jgi:hypothetical protein
MKLINQIDKWFQRWTYHNDIEDFIISRYPKDIADIERFTQEYNIKISKGSLQ